MYCIVLYCIFGLGSRHLCLPVEHNIKFPGPGQRLTENNSVVTSPSAGERAIPACMWLQLGFPNYNAGAYSRLKIMIKIYPVGDKPKWKKKLQNVFIFKLCKIFFQLYIENIWIMEKFQKCSYIQTLQNLKFRFITAKCPRIITTKAWTTSQSIKSFIIQQEKLKHKCKFKYIFIKKNSQNFDLWKMYSTTQTKNFILILFSLA